MFPIPNRWWIHDTRIVNTHSLSRDFRYSCDCALKSESDDSPELP